MSLDDRWAYSGPPPPTTESPARVSGGGEAGGSEHLLPGRAGDQCDERFRLWLEICTLAQDLLAFTQRLALTGAHRVAKPKRLRLRLRRRRAADPQRPPPHPQDLRQLTLGRRHHRGPSTTDRPGHDLTPQSLSLRVATGEPAEPVERATSRTPKPEAQRQDQQSHDPARTPRSRKLEARPDSGSDRSALAGAGCADREGL